MAKRKARQARRAVPSETAPAPEAGAEETTAADPAASDSATGGDASARRHQRGKLIGIGAAAVVLVLAILGAAVLASGDDSGELEYLDGVVVASEEDRLVLRLPEPVEGHPEQINMTIPPESAADVDIEHLDYHQVQGDIFRIYFERDGEEYIARRAEDIPGGEH